MKANEWKPQMAACDERIFSQTDNFKNGHETDTQKVKF